MKCVTKGAFLKSLYIYCICIKIGGQFTISSESGEEKTFFNFDAAQI